MTKEELQCKIDECRVLNEKFETAYSSKIRTNEELLEWLTLIETDLNDGVIPDRFIDIINHNINDLNLKELLSEYNNSVRQIGQEWYEKERAGMIIRCSDYLQTYKLYRSVGFAQKNTVIVGANGSGKTTLANKLKETLNVSDGIVIPAQKLLVIPTFDNIPTYKAERNPFIEYQNKVLDDKRTFKANKQDDFPYDIAKEYGSEYRKVLALLIAERNAKRNEVLDNKADGTIFHRSEIRTTIDLVVEIWNDLIPHRKMSLDTDSNLVIKYEKNGDERQYEAYRMSDGERIILYLVGRVMQAPKNSLVIVDEPEVFLHRTVVDKLWNRLEKERLDCTFIYMTHDLQFATSRVGLKSWIKSYEHPSKWKIQLIDESDIPEQLLLELLGSCKQILFCEGTSTKSLDKKIFDILFPQFTICPVESCKDVINYTKAYNRINQTNTKAYGLVDSDFRTNEEIAELKANNVFTYHLAEIENVFLVEDFIKSFRDYHHWVGDVDKIKQEIIEKFDKEKELQASLFLSARIDYYYKREHMPKGNTKAEVERKIKEFNTDIKIEEWYNKRMREIDLYIMNRNYTKVIAIYNNKGLCTVVEKELGIKDYHEKALEYLKIASDQVVTKLRELFPSELINLGV